MGLCRSAYAVGSQPIGVAEPWRGGWNTVAVLAGVEGTKAQILGARFSVKSCALKTNVNTPISAAKPHSVRGSRGHATKSRKISCKKKCTLCVPIFFRYFTHVLLDSRPEFTQVFYRNAHGDNDGAKTERKVFRLRKTLVTEP